MVSLDLRVVFQITLCKMARTISTQEISGHNILEDLWIVVNGKVYNITDFAPEHPGGAGSMGYLP